MLVAGVLGVVLVVARALALMSLSFRGGALARVDVADGALVVRPRGLNRLCAMKGEVRVPVAAIGEVRGEVDRKSVPGGLRLPGTYVPGLIQAGTYRTRGEKSFWLVGQADKVTVVECPGARYERLVLQLDDDAAADLLRAVDPGRAP